MLSEAEKEAEYQSYLKEFERRATLRFFEKWKDSKWFLELYDPEQLAIRLGNSFAQKPLMRRLERFREVLANKALPTWMFEKKNCMIIFCLLL